jgi:hypothetical protein
MQNELEMIQTLFQYKNFGLLPFPIKPFSQELYSDGAGFSLYKNALSGITISEEEIYEYFGSKKLDNCGLLLGEKGNLSVIEFESESRISQLITFIEDKPKPNISDVILINLLETGFESETSILTPENKIQMWFKFSKNIPNFHWKMFQDKTELNGINLLSNGYIVAPPSATKLNNNNIAQFEIINGKEPTKFPTEISFFSDHIS